MLQYLHLKDMRSTKHAGHYISVDILVFPMIYIVSRKRNLLISTNGHLGEVETEVNNGGLASGIFSVKEMTGRFKERTP